MLQRNKHLGPSKICVFPTQIIKILLLKFTPDQRTVWKIWAHQCQTAWTDIQYAPSGDGKVVIRSNICGNTAKSTATKHIPDCRSEFYLA